MMRRHFNIPEGCHFVAFDRDLRQSGRGGYFYNWDGVPNSTIVVVGDNHGKNLSHVYMTVHGDATTTQANRVAALSQAVADLAAEKAPVIATQISNTMTANVVESFHYNEKTNVLVQSFNANSGLRQQQLAEQERSRVLVKDMQDSGLADFFTEQEEKARQKRLRRDAREHGDE